MANVQYMVLYRYIHPVSGKPVSNKKKGYKQLFVEKISSSSGTEISIPPQSEFTSSDLGVNPATGNKYSIEEYANSRNYTSDECYDMLFLFSNIKKISEIGCYSTTHEYFADSFIQVNGDPWFTASVTGSLQSAMEAARRLIRKIGVANVKVVKQVPLDIEVVIE